MPANFVHMDFVFAKFAGYIFETGEHKKPAKYLSSGFCYWWQMAVCFLHSGKWQSGFL